MFDYAAGLKQRKDWWKIDAKPFAKCLQAKEYSPVFRVGHILRIRFVSQRFKFLFRHEM